MTYETASLIGSVVLVLCGPVGVILVATMIGRRGVRGRSLQLFVVGGVLASVLIFCFGGMFFHRLIPPPYDPAFAGGRGLDLRGFRFVLAEMFGGCLTFVLTLVYGFVLGRKKRRRPAEGAAPEGGPPGDPVT